MIKTIIYLLIQITHYFENILDIYVSEIQTLLKPLPRQEQREIFITLYSVKKLLKTVSYISNYESASIMLVQELRKQKSLLIKLLSEIFGSFMLIAYM